MAASCCDVRRVRDFNSGKDLRQRSVGRTGTKMLLAAHDSSVSLPATPSGGAGTVGPAGRALVKCSGWQPVSSRHSPALSSRLIQTVTDLDHHGRALPACGKPRLPNVRQTARGGML